MVNIKMACSIYLMLYFSLHYSLVSSRHTEVRQVDSDNSNSRNDTVLISLRPGQELKGFYSTLSTGTIIYKFLGIRYGEAPTGDRRFAEPEATNDWQGERDALYFGPSCWQRSFEIEDESEDCLFLNVYTPSITGTAPVMVWIHGGGYNVGTASTILYDGSFLAGKGVVIVSLNYRIGAFGFLSTGDEVMPGNYGMLDQVLALKWVQKNIHAFGGDPGNVTIFGESAGSSSVSLHVLSPLSRGLFHRAIMESGAALSIFAVERPAVDISVEEYTKRVGSDVGCADADSTVFLECLRKLDAEVLFNASYNLQQSLGIGIIATPRVETKFGFLPHYPLYILENGLFNKVDTLRGFNSGEWSFVISDNEDDGLTRDEFRSNLAKVFDTYLVNNRSRERLLDLAEIIYLGNGTNPIAIRSSLVTALTDMLFAASGLLELETYLAHGGQGDNHYVYELDYRVKSPLNVQSLTPEWWGVLHGADVPLVFMEGQVGAPASDVAVSEKMQTWWTNFAKYGNPSATAVFEDGTEVHWEQYTLANPLILKIDLKSSLVQFPRQNSLTAFKSVLDTVLNTNSTDI